jgi:sugar fermentation stimulation protein A
MNGKDERDGYAAPARRIPLLEIPRDAEGVFRSRPNRFLAEVDITYPGEEGEIHLPGEKVHVHDPGRLKEILIPGARLALRKAPEGSGRKTKWGLLAGYHGDRWVLVNSGFHRAISEAVLRNDSICPFGRLEKVRAEVKAGHSRLDFLVTGTDGKEVWIEVKGCTLAVDGKALFPDAPTTRGRKHLETLMELERTTDAAAALLVLVFRDDAVCFSPNAGTDPDFARTFREAVETGVGVYPILLSYEEDTVFYRGTVPLCDGP